ncbi:MAG: WbqC family protein [Candidatus Methylophosphatis roskildensis]
MRISIMQPYFLPYAGYFRLMCGVDAFVVLDDVQFPRGGWVHRNRLARGDGSLGWLTLPLLRQPVTGTIVQAALRRDALDGEWPRRVAAFPAGRWALDQTGLAADLVRLDSHDLAGNLLRGLRICADSLGMRVPFVRSSELAHDRHLKGHERIIAICRLLGATRYLNAPAGRHLYDVAQFARHGIALEFLPDYRGDPASILQRLFEMPVADIRHEIVDNMT